MKPNAGTIDRAIRALAGVGLLVAAAATPWRWVGLPGVVLLATAAMGFCPLYVPLGLSTTRGRGDASPPDA